MRHSFFKSVDAQFEHGKDLANDVDGAGIRPTDAGYGIKPDRMAEGFGQKLEATCQGLGQLALSADGHCQPSGIGWPRFYCPW